MRFEIENKDDGVILHLEDKIIGDGATQLKNIFEELIDSGIRWIIIDLADVPLMDSSAIGSIIMAYLKIKERNGKLVLLYAQKSILDVLNITKLNTLFEIYDNMQTALKAIESISQNS
ncbi:TPA: anti-sigma factor antagonist [bacterium]|nr:anti-sigma factor antagonist [bacterium]